MQYYPINAFGDPAIEGDKRLMKGVKHIEMLGRVGRSTVEPVSALLRRVLRVGIASRRGGIAPGIGAAGGSVVVLLIIHPLFIQRLQQHPFGNNADVLIIFTDDRYGAGRLGDGGNQFTERRLGGDSGRR